MVFWSEEVAEVYGALLGDGCLSSGCYAGRERFTVLFTGHTRDTVYYETCIRPVLLRTFGLKGYLHKRKSHNAVLLVYGSRKLFNFFVDLGFPIGKKEELSIPKVILDSRSLSFACVRGIFQTDGSIYNRYSKAYKNHPNQYFYKNIEFKMNSKNLLEQIRVVLERVGLKTGILRKNGTSFVLTMHSQSSVRRFYKLIQPNHPYYVERFLR